MGRLILLGLGVVGGAVGLRRVQRAARSYTPAGVAERAGGAWGGVRAFAAEVREGMREREEQLRVALQVDAGEMDPEAAAAMLENPTGRRGEH